MDGSFYEAIGLEVMQAECCMFESIFVGKGVSFSRDEGLSIVGKHFLGVPSIANSPVRQLMTALAVVEDILKRKGYLEK